MWIKKTRSEDKTYIWDSIVVYMNQEHESYRQDLYMSVGVMKVETPIDSGIDLSIRIDNLRVLINKTLSTDSLINQQLIKRACLSISIDSR